MKIYVVKIEDILQLEFEKIMDKITSTKRKKIDKFVFRKDKLRALISEILLRTILVKDFGISDTNVKVGENKYGKPYIEGYKDCNFNISHSGDFVVCAIDSKPIGVDIEQIVDTDYKSIIEVFFQEDDVNFILNGDANQQINRFYEIWTLKESYTKAEGMGLSIPLNSFGFKINDETIKLVNSDKEYDFKIYDSFSGYKMAVCSQNKQITDQIIKLKQSQLIDGYYEL